MIDRRTADLGLFIDLIADLSILTPFAFEFDTVVCLICSSTRFTLA
jgi:hypothetical protein